MFDNIRKSFFNKALKAEQTTQKRTRKVVSLSGANTISVLFDGTNERYRKEVLDLILSFEKQGKKLKSLGFINTKKPPENLGFEHFSLKETKWTGQPNSEKATAFSKEKTDLLLCFNPDKLDALTWIALASQAGMKVGLATDSIHDFDIQLDIPNDKPIRFFMDQLEHYLAKIK